jgi:hypothetical protein
MRKPKPTKQDAAFTPSLLVADLSWRPPRQDLTPDDLAAEGWFIQPYYDTERWVGRRENQWGGCLYSPAFADLEMTIGYIRQVYIRRQPWGGTLDPAPSQ